MHDCDSSTIYHTGVDIVSSRLWMLVSLPIYLSEGGGACTCGWEGWRGEKRVYTYTYVDMEGAETSRRARTLKAMRSPCRGVPMSLGNRA